MTNKSKKEYAYTVIDVDGSVSDEVASKLESIADVLGVRVIK
jgi:D-3-phosphoglycerate dehydrogenase